MHRTVAALHTNVNVKHQNSSCVRDLENRALCGSCAVVCHFPLMLKKASHQLLPLSVKLSYNTANSHEKSQYAVPPNQKTHVREADVQHIQIIMPWSIERLLEVCEGPSSAGFCPRSLLQAAPSLPATPRTSLPFQAHAVPAHSLSAQRSHTCMQYSTLHVIQVQASCVSSNVCISASGVKQQRAARNCGQHTA